MVRSSRSLTRLSSSAPVICQEDSEEVVRVARQLPVRDAHALSPSTWIWSTPSPLKCCSPRTRRSPGLRKQSRSGSRPRRTGGSSPSFCVAAIGIDGRGGIRCIRHRFGRMSHCFGRGGCRWRALSQGAVSVFDVNIFLREKQWRHNVFTLWRLYVPRAIVQNHICENYY